MSDLTICNFCSLRRIRAQAKERGRKVTILHDAHWGLGGVNVYVHPKDVNVRKMEGGEMVPGRSTGRHGSWRYRNHVAAERRRP